MKTSKTIKEERFVGERALFQSCNLKLEYCTFAEGESPLKESNNLHISHSLFQWKYPLWYSTNVIMEHSIFFEMARAGIWYSDHIKIKDFTVQAPKIFRRCTNLDMEDVEMPNAAETLWFCDGVKMKNVRARGDYFAMGSQNMEIEDFTLVGNYSFDGVKNMTIRNARILSKDAFWNAENVTVYDSFISGEYLGWNAKNVTLINCTIESEQGMCYMENVVMRDCKLLNTNLAFEYSTVDAQINSKIDSVKNPYSGKISAKDIGEIIFDNKEMKPENTEIIIDRDRKVYNLY